MVKIRLTRMGTKKEARYRLVAIDSRRKRDGMALENLGFLNPLIDPPAMTIKVERVRAWLDQGAQPTTAAASIIKRLGIDIP